MKSGMMAAETISQKFKKGEDISTSDMGGY